MNSSDKINSSHKCMYFEINKTCNDYDTCNVKCDQHELNYCVSIFRNDSGVFTPSWSGCMAIDSGMCEGHKVTEDTCHLKYWKMVGPEHNTICCCKGDMCNTFHVFNETLMTPPATTATSKWIFG